MQRGLLLPGEAPKGRFAFSFRATGEPERGLVTGQPGGDVDKRRIYRVVLLCADIQWR